MTLRFTAFALAASIALGAMLVPGCAHDDHDHGSVPPTDAGTDAAAIDAAPADAAHPGDPAATAREVLGADLVPVLDDLEADLYPPGEDLPADLLAPRE